MSKGDFPFRYRITAVIGYARADLDKEYLVRASKVAEAMLLAEREARKLFPEASFIQLRLMDKIDENGLPFDPSALARDALNHLRNSLVLAGGMGQGGHQKNQDALNAIADRLQTCDALEHKLRKLLEDRDGN